MNHTNYINPTNQKYTIKIDYAKLTFNPTKFLKKKKKNNLRSCIVLSVSLKL